MPDEAETTVLAEEQEVQKSLDKARQELAEIEAQISRLQAKRDQLEQEIVENSQQDNAVRNNLADWTKRLDSREQALQLREAKVAQAESHVVRNSGLLNL